MLFNFGTEANLKFSLVLGYAGSGKSFYCRSIASNDVMLNYHDEWVSKMYEVDQYTKDYIKILIPDAVCENKVIKPIILEAIMKDSTIGALLSGYWKSLYNDMLRDVIECIINASTPNPVQVFEVPYYDEELHNIVMEYKQHFSIHVVDTPRSVCYDRLKGIRKWSEYRIAMTLGMQDKMYAYIRKVLPYCDHQPMLCYTKGSGEKCFRTCRRCGVEIKYDGEKFSEVFK